MNSETLTAKLDSLLNWCAVNISGESKESKHGLTLFSPKPFDDAKLTSMCSEIGLDWQEKVPEVDHRGIVAKYKTSDGDLKDQQHMVFIRPKRKLDVPKARKHLAGLLPAPIDDVDSPVDDSKGYSM
tara:strand:- start:134 stop:514 length:381 start_codon:yes stop_codon:yes gene_type:complete